jgi:seryl-tRNA synthetase
VAKNKKAIDVVGTLTFDSDNTDTEQVSTELFDYPAEILSPTVCYHCFEAMSHTTISKHRVTALNKCHRHEPVNVGGLSRLTTYWMRELILFDDPDTLAEELDKSIDFTCALLEELDVGYEVVSANDPFFGTQGAGNRMMQSALQLKREIKVPIWGGRKIAIGSFNLHQETLLKKFDIEKAAQDDETLWSGCIGWGYDRFLLGILSRHGSDIDNWPDTAKCAFSLTRI